MSVLYKKFSVYVVETDGTTVYDSLGDLIYTIGEYNSSSSISLTALTSIAPLQAIISDCDKWGPAWLQYESNPYPDYLNAMLGFFPSTKVKIIKDTYAGKKLKYVSPSGYYAVTVNTIGLNPSSSVTGAMDLYDNNGTLLQGGAFGIFSAIFPNTLGSCKVFQTITGDTVSGLAKNATLMIRLGTSGYSLYADVTAGSNNANVTNWFNGCSTYDPSGHDPYLPGGESDTGGGTGSFDDTSVPITVPSLPTIAAVDTGFISLFNPTLVQLRALATYMWSGGFDLTTLRKLFSDPMDCILGLSIVPVAVPDGGLSSVKVGNNDTGIQMIKAGAQYVAVDCGSININEYWGAYLDYSPYTKVDLYLPYIGTHAINTDDVMNKSIHVLYHVDILSGACTAFVECGGTVIYEFIGQCSSSIPITGKDWTNVINGVLGIAGSIGTMIATGGASAPMGVPTLASSAVNALKPNVEKSGSMSGTGGMMAVQVPYIIVTRPKQALPSGQNSMEGYPSFVTRSLGSLSGYTEVSDIHLTGIPCTQQELDEIERLLGEGVYL